LELHLAPVNEGTQAIKSCDYSKKYINPNIIALLLVKTLQAGLKYFVCDILPQFHSISIFLTIDQPLDSLKNQITVLINLKERNNNNAQVCRNIFHVLYVFAPAVAVCFRISKKRKNAKGRPDGIWHLRTWHSAIHNNKH